MKKKMLLIIGLASFWAVESTSVETIGVTSDAVILPPDLHGYNPPPGAGSSYIDPAFGTRIIRVTDASRFNQFVLGGYLGNSEICYFNKDGSYFLASENENIDGNLLISTFLYDGRTGARIRFLGVSGSSLQPYWIRWALADRYKLGGQTVYFDPNNHFYKYENNEIRLYDVRSMNEYKILHRFDEYSSIGPAGGEGDISLDGRYWVLDGDEKELFVYDLIDDVKHPVSKFNLGSLGSKGGNVGVDYAAVSPTGKYAIVSWGTDPGAGKRYAGIELYDKSWNFIRQLHPSIVHWTVGIDHFGDEVLYTVVTHDYPDFFKSCGATPGDIVSVRLSDGYQRLLKDIPVWAHMSISACNAATNGDFIYVAYHRRSEDPTSLWAPFWDEIIEVPTDGSQKVRRFVHHRSHYVQGQSTKYYQPDAMVNRQGTRIIYRSTYNNGVGDLYFFSIISDDLKYDDVMPPNPPSGLRSGEVDESSIEIVWSQPPSAADGDLPVSFRVYRDDKFLAEIFETRYRDFSLEESSTFEYSVFSVDKASNTSPPARLKMSTLADLMPPYLLSSAIKSSTEVELLFSEPLEMTSATNINNYHIEPPVAIALAQLSADGRSVVLSVGPLALGVAYQMEISNLTDTASNRNRIADDTVVHFSLLSGFYDDFENGMNPAWYFYTPSRWQLADQQGNQVLFLNTSNYGDLSQKRLGEFALIRGSKVLGDSVRISCLAKSNEDVIANNQADYAVLFGFVDDKNYYYVQIQPEEVKLHRIENGARTLFEQFTFRSFLDEWQRIAVELRGDHVLVLLQGQQVFDYQLPKSVVGEFGIGSFNDSVWFDNVNIGSNLDDNVPPQAPSGLKVIRDKKD